MHKSILASLTAAALAASLLVLPGCTSARTDTNAPGNGSAIRYGSSVDPLADYATDGTKEPDVTREQFQREIYEMEHSWAPSEE